MKEAYLWEKAEDNQVKCKNCSHYCLIAEGKQGICGVRENIKGKLYALNYGRACATAIDPIEKKPFFHFLPGTSSLSFATIGCNFACFSCQNWQISQAPKLTSPGIPSPAAGANRPPAPQPRGPDWGEEVLPQEVVSLAIKSNCPSISYTYTEPTIFSEYALDTMKLAKKAGLKNNWVSNGFWSKELFDLISPYLDAVNVDLKAFDENFYQKYCGGRLKPVLDNLKRIKAKRIWLEVTTLVIPTLNDQEKTFYNIAKFIKKELGEETPWHITQFCGAISWKLKDIADTPAETLIKARKIGLGEGLLYVYTGNIPGLKGEGTFCPKCQTLMIDRAGYVVQRHDNNGRCSKCGEELHIIE